MTPRASVLAVLLLGTAGSVPAQQGLDTVQVRVVPVTDGVAMLVGAGGNIAMAHGADGVFLVDDQYAPLTPKIRAAVASLSSRPIRFVLNTHWHGDHTGGNEAMGQAGALVVAHDNVRKRMSADQLSEFFRRTIPASPAGALPVVTFTEAVTFHLNGDEVFAFHVAASHTDGDAVVHWRRANVVHMGDTFFNNLYPFIDLESGGSLDGLIATVNRVLAEIDDRTRIIPGHGALATREDLARYRDLLVTARERVGRLVREGKSVEEVVAARPLAEFDAMWGWAFISGETFLRILYRDLKK